MSNYQSKAQMTDLSSSEEITVRFPYALLVASREDPQQFQRRVMIQTLGSLYEQGRISSGLGAQVLGCSRWEFYRLISEQGFSVIDYAQGDEIEEAETSRLLAESIR